MTKSESVVLGLGEVPIFYVVPIILKVVDWGSTVLLLSITGLRGVEANPITAFLLNIHPLFALAVVLTVQLGLCYALRWSWRETRLLPKGGDGYRFAYSGLMVLCYVVAAVPVVNNGVILLRHLLKAMA